MLFARQCSLEARSGPLDESIRLLHDISAFCNMPADSNGPRSGASDMFDLIRRREYDGALDSMHREFDRSGSIHALAYAALSHAELCMSFGEEDRAVQIYREAIRVAQETQGTDAVLASLASTALDLAPRVLHAPPLPFCRTSAPANLAPLVYVRCASLGLTDAKKAIWH